MQNLDYAQNPHREGAKRRRKLVLTPYSWSARRNSNRRFPQQQRFFRRVQICGFGDAGQRKEAAFPCIGNKEAPRSCDICLHPGTENSALLVRRNADEGFWRFPTMESVRGVPRLRVLTPNTRCLKSESRTAGRALLPKRILR